MTRKDVPPAEQLPRRSEDDMCTPTQRLLDRIASLDRIDTRWGDEYAAAKQAETAERAHDTAE